MLIQTCTKCRNTKPVSDFYKDPKAPSGHRAQCKDCICRYFRKRRRALTKTDPVYRAKNRLKGQRWRLRNGDHVKEYNRQRHKDPRVQIAQYKAHRHYNAPPQCVIEGCENKAEYRHHIDYDEPLKIMWLCRLCHSAFHRTFGMKSSAIA
jgi:hypothetical protein